MNRRAFVKRLAVLFVIVQFVIVGFPTVSPIFSRQRTVTPGLMVSVA